MPKAKTNKSQAIRDMVAANPKAKSSEIVKLLADKGINVSGTLVYGVKAQGKAKKRKLKREKAIAAGKTMGNGDAVELIKAVRGVADQAGGLERLKALVELLLA